MAKMNSPFKYMYDAAPEAAVVVKDHATHTATFNAPAVSLDLLAGYWNQPNPGLADQTFAIVVNVESLDFTTADETYALELEFGPAGFATSVKPFKLNVTKPGQYAFLVDLDTIRAIKADADTFRLVATLGGTTPIIALHAWNAGAIIR